MVGISAERAPAAKLNRGERVATSRVTRRRRTARGVDTRGFRGGRPHRLVTGGILAASPDRGFDATGGRIVLSVSIGAYPGVRKQGACRSRESARYGDVELAGDRAARAIGRRSSARESIHASRSIPASANRRSGSAPVDVSMNAVHAERRARHLRVVLDLLRRSNPISTRRRRDQRV